MRGLFWLLVIAGIVAGPLLIVQFDVIGRTTDVTEEAVVVVKDKTDEVMATRAAEGRVSDRIRQAGEGIQADSKVAEIELKIHAGINAERLHGRANALMWDDRLAALARAHSDDMTARNYEGHFSPEGLGPIDRLHRAGLSCRKQTHVGISENITVVLADQIIEPSSDSLAVDAVRSWGGSPGHRQNFMARKFGSTGVGASYGTWEGRKAVYLTQVFC